MPIKKTREVEYWECGRGHQHTTEEIARKCEEKRVRNPRFEAATRDKMAAELLAGGVAAEIARKHGCSPATVAHWAEKAVVAHPKYTWYDYFEVYRKPGHGTVKACQAYWRKLTSE